MAVERIGDSLREESGIEREVVQSAGVALLIVGFDPLKNGDNITDPLIWTITELQDKPETQKRAGDTSIPSETRKQNETRTQNILGALAEFCDEGCVGGLSRHLFFAPGSYKDEAISINGNLVDIGVLVYDGPLDVFFNPQNCEEVSGNGWQKRSVIEQGENIRSVLRLALEEDKKEGLTRKALETYYANSGIQIVPEGFSIRNYYQARESRKDLTLKKG